MRSMLAWLLLGLAVPALGAGCASSPRVASVPDSAWQAAADSPRSSRPTLGWSARTAEPMAAPRPLTRDEVLAITTRRDAPDAIAEIDRHPLAFRLDSASLDWFEDRLVPPEVIDYLRKRAQVDWRALNGASPRTEQPQGETQDFLVEQPEAAPAPDGASSAPSSSYAPSSDSSSAPSTVVVDDAPPSTTTVIIREQAPEPVYVDGVVWTGAVWYDGGCWRPWRSWYRCAPRYVDYGCYSGNDSTRYYGNYGGYTGGYTGYRTPNPVVTTYSNGYTTTGYTYGTRYTNNSAYTNNYATVRRYPNPNTNNYTNNYANVRRYPNPSSNNYTNNYSTGRYPYPQTPGYSGTSTGRVYPFYRAAPTARPMPTAPVVRAQPTRGFGGGHGGGHHHR